MNLRIPPWHNFVISSYQLPVVGGPPRPPLAGGCWRY